MKKLVLNIAAVVFGLLVGLSGLFSIFNCRGGVFLSQPPVHGTSFLVELDPARGQEDTNILTRVREVMVSRDSLGRAQIMFILDSEGAAIFATATRENIGHQLAVVLDGEIQSVPVIRQPIEGGSVMISGQFTDREALRLANALKCSLPAPVKIVEQKTF